MSVLKADDEAQGILEMIDHFDRPGNAYSEGVYADTDTYAHGLENKPGRRIPKAGAIAEADVGRAGAEWSIFSVKANGPRASAFAEVNPNEAKFMAQAQLASASATAGPLKVKVGLGIDTGVKISPSKIQLKILGTGLMLGSTTAISFFGSEVKIKFW
ncbi:hypothetical protein KOW79_011078 [Hemibagrus wyckioides]|uniref:Uncharacterized protein n=1 Tax=Hemibagrus wyckioides TaxID=337641 RepID=A0A9D3NM60_9TELE|nr:hypothetical protein KOW79_011078 [Hemibagrus wyckioides]